MTDDRCPDCGSEIARLRICIQCHAREMSYSMVHQLAHRETILEAAQMTAETALGPGTWERDPKAREEWLRQVSAVSAALSELLARADDTDH